MRKKKRAAPGGVPRGSSPSIAYDDLAALHGMLLMHRRRGGSVSGAGIGGSGAARDRGPIIVLVVFTGIIRQCRGRRAEDEGRRECNLRVGEHCRVSWVCCSHP